MEIIVHVTAEGESAYREVLTLDQSARLVREAKVRRKPPAALLFEIVKVVLTDNLMNAVLDIEKPSRSTRKKRTLKP